MAIVLPKPDSNFVKWAKAKGYIGKFMQIRSYRPEYITQWHQEYVSEIERKAVYDTPNNLQSTIDWYEQKKQESDEVIKELQSKVAILEERLQQRLQESEP